MQTLQSSKELDDFLVTGGILNVTHPGCGHCKELKKAYATGGILDNPPLPVAELSMSSEVDKEELKKMMDQVTALQLKSAGCLEAFNRCRSNPGECKDNVWVTSCRLNGFPTVLLINDGNVTDFVSGNQPQLVKTKVCNLPIAKSTDFCQNN